MDHGHEDMSQGQKTIYALVVVALVLGAGLMSGLTLGLLSMDVMDLEVLRVAGSIKERARATRLIKLVSKPHWLLCTLLLCNAGCMEALPLFLDRLLDPVGAILLSVTAILLFGEIIPQALCSRYGVAIGAAMSPLVRGLMWVCAPITWPLGRLLDIILGHREGVMKRRELKAMVTLHGEGAGFGGALSPQEVAVIHGAMDLTNKTALTAMTPIEKVFMLSDATLLDESTIKRVLQSGHSRVPVYRGDNTQDIAGLVLVKELLQFWRANSVPSVTQLELRAMPHIPADTPMFDVLRLFQTGRSHMALLMAPEGTDIEHLRRTRGRLASRDTESGNNINDMSLYGVESMELDSISFTREKRKSDEQLGKAAKDQQDGMGMKGQEEQQKKNKKVSWNRSGSGGNRKSNEDSKEANMQQQQQQQGSDFVALEIAQPSAATAAAAAADTAADSPLDMQAAEQTVVSSSSSTTYIWAPLLLLPEQRRRLVPVGILTLEDIIEELLQTEIIDETDRFMDNEQTQAVDLHNLISSLPPHLHAMLRAEMLAAAENFLQSAKAAQNGTVISSNPAAAAAVMKRASSFGAAATFDAVFNDTALHHQKVTILGKLGNEAPGRLTRSSDPGTLAAAVAAAAAAKRTTGAAVTAPATAAAAAATPEALAEAIRAPSTTKSFKSVSLKSVPQQAASKPSSPAAAAEAAAATTAAAPHDAASVDL